MTAFTPALPLDTLLAASEACPEFKADVLAYAAFQRAERVVAQGHAPRVKVLRVVAQLLHHEPSMKLDSVRVAAAAGCCDFRGVVTATAGDEVRSWEFVWDCRWRARQAGLLDSTGHPDQAWAAREYGWRCFSHWQERPVSARVLAEA